MRDVFQSSLNMAPGKKSKNPPEQELSKREKKRIQDNIATYANDHTAWQAHYKTFDVPKKNNVNRFFEEAKSEWKSENAEATGGAATLRYDRSTTNHSSPAAASMANPSLEDPAPAMQQVDS